MGTTCTGGPQSGHLLPENVVALEAIHPFQRGAAGSSSPKFQLKIALLSSNAEFSLFHYCFTSCCQ
jgi:hypothetical protein